jgi:anti-sigma regulatory factor (Ser/Thr protein kinase)
MERTEETFDGCLKGIHLVRAFVMTTLADHPCRDEAVLVAHEFAANAIRHASAAKFRVELESEGARIRIAVVAASSRNGIPHVKGETETEEGGRGLLLVEALADAWGFTPHGTDMTIWALLGLAPVS